MLIYVQGFLQLLLHKIAFAWLNFFIQSFIFLQLKVSELTPI
jgi:hypothetical protein